METHCILTSLLRYDIMKPLTKHFALVKYGGGIIQMSGSIAGNTFARNRYGNYARARTKPVNPNSTRQVKIRSIIAVLTERWIETLTAAQRIAWQTYGDSVVMKNKLGESIKLTGFNHYIRSNSVRVDIGLAVVDSGPTALTLPDKDPAFAVGANAGTQLLTINFDDALAWNTEDGAFISLLLGQPQNITRNFFAGPYRGIHKILGVDPGGVASPQTVAAIFTLTQGQKIWTRARIGRADGRLSEPFVDDTTVAA